MKKIMIFVSVLSVLSLGFGYYGQKEREAGNSKVQQRDTGEDDVSASGSGVGSTGSGGSFGDKGEVVKTVQYLPQPGGQQGGMSKEQEDFRREAILKIQVASKLAQNAQNMVRTNPTKDTLMAAINIFAEAGQLFEQSSRMLKLLGPQYVNPADLEGCEKAVKGCLDSIRMCKERAVAMMRQESPGSGVKR
jgi:hypothetical protein